MLCRVRHRARQLKRTGVESLVLAVEVFNRPSPVARTSGVLLNLQHALEMLFKAAIYERRGTILPKRGKIAYSFSECLGILRSGELLLNEHQALAAAIIDSHRDAVQHWGAAMREQALYVDIQSGLTLCDDFLKHAFGETLADEPAFAGRTLPVCTNPPREFHVLAGGDFAYIAELLAPGHRRRAEALSLLRPYTLTDRVVLCEGEVAQPTENELKRVGQRIVAGEQWETIFPGLARLAFDIDESAVYGLRITKEKTATPVRLVKPDDPLAASAAAVLEVDSLNKFPFYAKHIAQQAGVNSYEAWALIYLLDLQSNPKAFKLFMLGSQPHKRYSHLGLKLVRDALAAGRLDEARDAYRAHRQQQPKPRAA